MKKIITMVLAPIIAFAFGAPVLATETVVEKNVEPVKASAKAKLIDINTATKAELIAILGVGEGDADNIIAARPFMRKDQLKTKHVVPANTYEKIKKLIDAVC